MDTNNVKINEEKFEYQKGISDCGVACLVSIIRYFGENCDYKRIAKNSNIGICGTNIIGLKNAARLAGYNLEAFEFYDLNEFKNKASFPCIVLIKKYIFLNHYIICFETPSEEFISVFDPSKGFDILITNHFLNVWKDKIALILTKH